MTEKKPPQTADDVLRDLHEFLLGAEPDFQSMPIEKVQEYLKEAGVDPTDTIRNVRKQVAKAKGSQALRAAQAKRKEQASRPATKAHEFKDLPGMARDQLIAIIQSMAGPKQAAVYMRDYEDADEEDLRSLIKDLQALQDDDDIEG